LRKSSYFPLPDPLGSEGGEFFMGKFPQIAKIVGIGWYIGVSIAGGTWLGVVGDRSFGTSPFLTILGLFLGVILAFYGTYRMLRSYMEGG